MITDEQIASVLGEALNDTSFYDDEDMRRVAALAYFKGQQDATRLWAWWKDGTQYVGTTGHTLAQALDVIAFEQFQLLGEVKVI